MSHIPFLKTENNYTSLIVDGDPFLILGGELLNSSGSSLDYLEEKVWPGLRKLGGNCYLTPVYWECLEPEHGKYDFALVDGVIAQARREGVKLVFLWFGLWKSGASTYIPKWMKKDSQYFYMRGQDGRYVESVSPLCTAAVEADAIAFEALMAHLRDTDTERTVIMVQVENEAGIWHHPRDYSEASQKLFYSEIPAEMADLYSVTGTWEAAFGLNACEYFMAWQFAKAVGKVAARGREIYPLPQFVNCVPNGMGISQLAGSCPSGGPVPRVNKIWRTFAPSIDLYGPNIYTPDYRKISGDFAAINPLIVPEMGDGIDAAPKAMFTVAAYNTIGFSPFAIDSLMNRSGDSNLPLSMANAGAPLAEAYRLLLTLWPQIRAAQQQGNIYAFVQQSDMGHEFVLDDYVIEVNYGGNYIAGMPPKGPEPRQEGKPMGGGFILRLEKDHFLLCGISCNVNVKPRYASQEQIFILEKRELYLMENCFVPGRILNGDERMFSSIGATPAVQEFSFYHR